MSEEKRDATRRTWLAVERTELAWWRTGLTTLAVAVGIGRVVPELSDEGAKWPYEALGIGFAVYALALFVYGSRRSQAVERALRDDTDLPPASLAGRFLMVSGAILCAAVAITILL
jgi:putative membrane protein